MASKANLLTNLAAVDRFSEGCLKQALHLFEAHLEVNRFNKCSGDMVLTDTSRKAALCVRSLAEGVRSLISVLCGDTVTHSFNDADFPSGGADPGGSPKPLCGPWLACLCKYLESSGLWLVIVVQSLVKVSPGARGSCDMRVSIFYTAPPELSAW